MKWYEEICDNYGRKTYSVFKNAQSIMMKIILILICHFPIGEHTPSDRCQNIQQHERH